MKYAYNVIVEPQPAGSDGASSLQFGFESHDDVLAILEGLRGQESLDKNTRAALIVGIKSLGYAILANRDSQTMAGLLPQFKALMKELKQGLAGDF
ncbi:DUF3861 family protein [Desulfoplanes sp.]